jgi:hypothetical protein
MLDLAAARSLIQEQIAAEPAPTPDDELVILDEHTMERDWGWVFFYDSRRYRETGNSRFLVAGNAPFFVRRTDGAVFTAGTAYPVEHYIEDFESGGNLVQRCS